MSVRGLDIALDTLGGEGRLQAGSAGKADERRLGEAQPIPARLALDNVLRNLTRPEGSTLSTCNCAFHRLLLNGVTAEYRVGKDTIRGEQAQAIDFDCPDNNDWLAVNRVTVAGNCNTRRPDAVLFVNGLPLGVIE